MHDVRQRDSLQPARLHLHWAGGVGVSIRQSHMIYTMIQWAVQYIRTVWHTCSVLFRQRPSNSLSLSLSLPLPLCVCVCVCVQSPVFLARSCSYYIILLKECCVALVSVCVHHDKNCVFVLTCLHVSACLYSHDCVCMQKMQSF